MHCCIVPSPHYLCCSWYMERVSLHSTYTSGSIYISLLHILIVLSIYTWSNQTTNVTHQTQSFAEKNELPQVDSELTTFLAWQNYSNGWLCPPYIVPSFWVLIPFYQELIKSYIKAAPSLHFISWGYACCFCCIQLSIVCIHELFVVVWTLNSELYT